MISPIILVAEDNPITARQLGSTLRGEGFSVLDAANAAVAVDLAHRITPDLVVMELLLPDGNGFQTLRRLRRVRGCNHLPAVACTGLLSSADEAATLGAGFVALLPKPVLPSVLLSAVRRALAGAGGTRLPARRRIDIVGPGEAWAGALGERLVDLDYVTAVYGSGEVRLRSRGAVPALLVSGEAGEESALRLCRALRARPAWRDVPLIFTGDSPLDPPVRAALLGAGASAVVPAGPEAVAVVRAVVDALELSARKPCPELRARSRKAVPHPLAEDPQLAGTPRPVAASAIAAAARLALNGGVEADDADLLCPGTLTTLLHHCTHLTGLPLAALYLWDASSSELELRAWSGALAGVGGERVRQALDGTEELRRCGEQGTRVVMAPARAARGSNGISPVEGMGPGVFVPIRAIDGRKGVLFLATGAQDLAAGDGRWVAELAAAVVAPILGLGELLDQRPAVAPARDETSEAGQTLRPCCVCRWHPKERR